jgi:hypothetical protein
MRLDFSNIGRGLSAIADAKRARDLARESARYDVTEGAYGEELEQNVEQVRGLMRQAQQQAAAQGGTVEDMARIEAQYMPSIDELQRRSRMTAPDFTIASRAMRPEDTFATREEATRAARPMRAEGLARVYERFGDVERAESLRERADAARLRDIQFQGAELGLRGAQRTEREAEGMQMAQQLIMGAQQAGQPIDSDFLRVVASQTGANYNALIDSAAKELGFTEASGTAALKKLQRDLATASAKGISGINEFLAASFDPDKSDDIVPTVVRDRQGNYVVQYGDRVLSEYGAHKSLDFLVGTVQGRITGDPLATLKTLADIEASKAQTGLRTEQTRALRNNEAIAAERARIVEEYESLTPEERLGPKGQALMRQFNMVNVRAGGTVPLGGQARAEKPLTPDQDNAWKLLQKSDLFDRAFRANDLPAMRKLLLDRGIPLTVLPGLAAEPPGGGSMTPAQPEPVAGTTDEPVTAQPRPAMTRGQVRQDARVRAELSQQFEALPEAQAMMQQLESGRAGLRRGGREDTRALSAQIAQMREQFIAERMGLR